MSFDHQKIATGVCDSIRKHVLTVDNSAVIEAIRSEYRSTREGISALHEAVGHIELDNSPVVKKLVDAIARMNVPDSQTIANAVNERMRRQPIGVDNGEVLQAMRKIKAEVDLTPILTAIKKVEDEARRPAVEPDASPVVGAINAMQLDLGVIHEAIGRIYHALDFGPVLEAIRRISISGEAAQELASLVQEKLRNEIQAIDLPEKDLEPLISAINAAEVDLSPVIDAIGTLNVIVDTMRTEMKQLLRQQRVVEKEHIVETVVPQIVNKEGPMIQRMGSGPLIPVVPVVVPPPGQISPRALPPGQLSPGLPPPGQISPNYRKPITGPISGPPIIATTPRGPPSSLLCPAPPTRPFEIVAPRSVDVVQPRHTDLGRPLTRAKSMERFAVGQAQVSQFEKQRATERKVVSTELPLPRPPGDTMPIRDFTTGGMATSRSASTLSPAVPRTILAASSPSTSTVHVNAVAEETYVTTTTTTGANATSVGLMSPEFKSSVSAPAVDRMVSSAMDAVQTCVEKPQKSSSRWPAPDVYVPLG